jgi:hypothetical protein
MVRIAWGNNLMTINYFTFNPNALSNYSFQPILDGQTYTVLVNWNVYGQRYYVNISDLYGTLIVCLPLIGSPDTQDISMTAGYFTSKLVYRNSSGNFEATS